MMHFITVVLGFFWLVPALEKKKIDNLSKILSRKFFVLFSRFLLPTSGFILRCCLALGVASHTLAPGKAGQARVGPGAQ